MGRSMVWVSSNRRIILAAMSEQPKASRELPKAICVAGGIIAQDLGSHRGDPFVLALARNGARDRAAALRDSEGARARWPRAMAVGRGAVEVPGRTT